MIITTHRFIAGFDDKPNDLFYNTFKDLSGKNVITTDTYFNRFPASHMLQNTDIDEFILSGSFNKNGKLVIYAASDTPPISLKEFHVIAYSEFSINLPKNYFLNMWVEFTSPEDLSVSDISQLDWSVRLDSRPEKLNVNLATVTISEQEMVQANLDRLAKLRKSEFYTVDEIFVIDQGNQNWDAEYLSKVKLISQNNLGGSGGFARAFFESTGGTANGILIFDADVEIFPEIVDRILTIAFLNMNASPISTQMLNSRIPHELLNDNEKLDLKAGWVTLTPQGRQYFHANSRFINLPDPDFLPWWAAYLPMHVIEKIGLPFPFFLHWDDIEYSLRLKKNKIRVLHVPGLCVWHQPFDGKSDKDWIWYFDTRNALVGGALYNRPFIVCLLKTWHRVLLPTFSHRYQIGALGRRAIYDFLNASQAHLYSGNQKKNLGNFKISGDNQLRIEDYAKIAQLDPPRSYPKSRLLLLSFLRICSLKDKSQVLYIAESSSASGFLPSFGESVIIKDRYGSIVERLQYQREFFLESLVADLRALTIFTLRYQKAAKRHRSEFSSRISYKNWVNEWS